MSNSSVGGVPTSGLGVAAAVKLTGTGVVQTRTPVANTRGVAQYTVSIPLGGSVQVTSSAIDDAGAVIGTVASGGGVLDSHLGTAVNFVILGASAVTGSTGGGSTVSGGNIGIAPNNASSVTNFPPSTLTSPGVFHYADAAATQAQIDLAAAIVYFQGLTPTLSGLGNLSTGGNGVNNHTYTAGNYFGATSLDIPTSITLDGQGNANAVFVFVAGSTITLESNASVLLVNGAQAQNVYWVNGSTFTSVFGTVSAMVGTILAHTTVTLGGGTLNGRALANIGAVTLSTTEVISLTPVVPASPQTGWNAIVYNNVPQSSNPAWYRPSNAGKYSNTYFAPVSVDDTDSNPWTVRGRVAGQCVVEFQIPTFLNTEGTLLTDVNTVMDETPIDSISAELICTVTGGTS
jgi:hypothetical protein